MRSREDSFASDAGSRSPVYQQHQSYTGKSRLLKAPSSASYSYLLVFPAAAPLAGPSSFYPSPALDSNEGFYAPPDCTYETRGPLTGARTIYPSHEASPNHLYAPSMASSSSSSSSTYSHHSYQQQLPHYHQPPPPPLPPASYQSTYRHLPPPHRSPLPPPPSRHYPTPVLPSFPSPEVPEYIEEPARSYYYSERPLSSWSLPPSAPTRSAAVPNSHGPPPFERSLNDYHHRALPPVIAPSYPRAEYRGEELFQGHPLLPPTSGGFEGLRIFTNPTPRSRENSFGSSYTSDEDRYDEYAEEKHEPITPFVSKLAHLLSHPEYAKVIRWNDAGTAFTFAHGSAELASIFSRFFRHSNTSSFVRQLNIYAFTRLSTLELIDALPSNEPRSVSSSSEFSGFFHPLFYRDAPGRVCDLHRVKPKVAKKKKSLNSLAPEVRKRSLSGTGKSGATVKLRKVT